jgi:hypothetical protein
LLPETKEVKLSMFIISCIFSIPVFTQTGTELMVYSFKGNVTVIENDTETSLKIGKLLKPGVVIKVDKDAALTMICMQGKPLKVNKEGTFPVSTWKDSCHVKNHTLSGNYFRYIWGEFYTHSPEYQEQLRKRNEGAVTRSPVETNEFKPNKKIKIEFSKGMDTVNIGSKDFPLAWTGIGYTGKYQFRLYTNKKRKLILRDSIFRSYISTEKLRDRLETGKSFVWTISAPKSGTIRKRILNIVSDEKIQTLIDELLNPVEVEEDSAAIYFRTAYMLEMKHYLAQAYIYYKKALEANPEFQVYSDKLNRFRSEYWVH